MSIKGGDDMTAEEYLSQIKKIDAIIINKKRDYKRWLDIADGVGGFSVAERVQTTRNLQRGSDAIAEYIGIEEEIKELEKKRQSIIDTIESLPYYEYKILYMIYVDGYMVKELPSELDKSYSWVLWKKREALRQLQSILDKR